MNEEIEVTMRKRFPPISSASQIVFHAFSSTQEPEGDEYFIEYPDSLEGLIIPAIGSEVIHLLKQGLLVGEASSSLHQSADEEYDIIDFIQTLMENGFVAKVDGLTIDQEKR